MRARRRALGVAAAKSLGPSEQLSVRVPLAVATLARELARDGGQELATWLREAVGAAIVRGSVKSAGRKPSVEK